MRRRGITVIVIAVIAAAFFGVYTLAYRTGESSGRSKVYADRSAFQTRVASAPQSGSGRRAGRRWRQAGGTRGSAGGSAAAGGGATGPRGGSAGGTGTAGTAAARAAAVSTLTGKVTKVDGTTLSVQQADNSTVSVTTTARYRRPQTS